MTSRGGSRGNFFPCPNRSCTMSFTNKTAYLKHLKLHEGLLPWRCKFSVHGKKCDYAAAHKFQVVHHVRSVHYGLPKEKIAKMKITDDNAVEVYVFNAAKMSTVFKKVKKRPVLKKTSSRTNTSVETTDESNIAFTKAKRSNASTADSTSTKNTNSCTSAASTPAYESNSALSDSSEIAFSDSNVACTVELVSSFECPFKTVCGKSFTDEESLQGHIRSHVGVYPFRCLFPLKNQTDCSFRASEMHTIHQHIVSEHNIAVNKQSEIIKYIKVDEELLCPW